MFKIGYRTLKTAIGVTISIAIAKLVGLDSFASAGILTILCIKVTRKKSLESSWERFVACVIGIFFSILFFEGIGYHPVTIGLLLLFFIPTMVIVRAKDGIVTSSVIILHIFTAGNVTVGLILNELGLIIIGIGVALLINLYMPSVDKELRAYQQEIEALFGNILNEMVHYLRTGESIWEGREITRIEELLKKAKRIAYRDIENHLMRDEGLFFTYFDMREKQFEILQRMLPTITSITHSVEQREMVADFIMEVSMSIHPGNTAVVFLKKLEEMRKTFREMPLPQSRDEFETRAALFQFIKEMEEYLIVKSLFKGLPT
ncbi:aromatic acid exporter family protein [Bacillus nitroreducens]